MKGESGMSKKMKIFTAGALGIMMAGLVCTNVYALDKYLLTILGYVADHIRIYK